MSLGSARRHQYPKDLAWMLTPVKQLCLAQRKESFLARNAAPVKLAMALTEDLPQACVQSLFAAWSAFGEGGEGDLQFPGDSVTKSIYGWLKILVSHGFPFFLWKLLVSFQKQSNPLGSVVSPSLLAKLRIVSLMVHYFTVGLFILYRSICKYTIRYTFIRLYIYICVCIYVFMCV